MPLSVRPTPYEVPAYSLTGDLLSYRTCGLQYRYQNRGALPPSKPVQLWFGQFIHGVMEEAYRFWKAGNHSFPWSDPQLQPIIHLIIRRLAARGIHFQRVQLLAIAIERAFVAINTWGPFLFPEISDAEVTLRGIRQIPAATDSIRQSNYYEVQGVVDVMTRIQLNPIVDPNPFANAILGSLTNQTYELIIDYKGMRRPSLNDPHHTSWQDHRHQVLTYAWLRGQQPGSPDVRSGILLYLNELVPSTEDMDRLYEDIYGAHSSPINTDLVPTGADAKAIQNWPRIKRLWRDQLALTKDLQANVNQASWLDQVSEWWKSGRDTSSPQPFPRMPTLPGELSFDYRKRRSFREVAVNPGQIQASLEAFDHIVAEIESSVARESRGGIITKTWTPNPAEETCTACDFKTFCPASAYRGAPSAP
ncbi:MAG TPA: PD-(D/E)XK nuclease family protein [Chloroflexia bacterium]|nr:PD-(D/E)XK nuclease family protein [Chloroflexia bacterium]